jgi:mono/diheme cytochrome c family protein
MVDMSKLLWFLAGVAALALIAAAGVFLALRGADGFSARSQPSPVERWAARTFRSSAVPASAKARANPVPATPEVLAEARAHWADHCAGCHANDGSGEIDMGKRMYPPAPDMRESATQNLSDGELFYIIENGIRFTGMPAWGGGGRDENDSWKLVRFIRHLPQLTFEEKREMEKLNPKGPEDRKEEEEEEKFLRGESDATETSHHHH